MSSVLQPLTTPREALHPPSADGRGTGWAMSLLAHALLIAGLTLGVQWHTADPAGVEAELWAAVPQRAAPPAAAPPPPAEAPAPTPPPAATKPPPREEEPEADIAREREQQRQKQAKAEREKALKAEQDRRDQAREKAREQAQQKARQEEAERQAKAEQARKDKAAQARAEAARQAQLQRLAAQLGGPAGNGPAGSTGTAEKSAGPSATYGGRIKAYIKPNIVQLDSIAGNPTAEVEVRAAPDGTILGRRLIKPSGNREWDDNVLRAIDRTGRLPRDTDGRVPPTLVISFRPQE